VADRGTAGTLTTNLLAEINGGYAGHDGQEGPHCGRYSSLVASMTNILAVALPAAAR
jgi:hypothetical protein